MPGTRRDRHESAWRIAYICACVLLCALVLGVFVYRPGINGYSRAMFADMVYGTAAKPFVYRTLLPTAVRLVASAVPDDSRIALSESLARSAAGENLCKILGWEAGYLFEYLVALALMWGCLGGFVWALRYLLNGVYQVSPRVRDVFTLVALLGLTQFFRYYSYLYDFPAVCLFTLGLALMVRAKWKTFVLLYLIACLNKETTILLTVVFAVHFWSRTRMNRTRFAGLLAAQAAIFTVVKLGLFAAFRDNPGALVEVHFPHHNLEVLGAYPLAAVFGWCGLALLLFYKWPDKPLFLRHSLWIVPPLVGLTFCFGYLDELRDYYEAYPILALLLLHSVSRVWGFEVGGVNQPAPLRC